VVVLAQEEARALKHNYIGTEHILLGLLREEEGLAARVLQSLDMTVEGVRAQVVRIVGAGDEATSGQIPFTPRAKKVLELALREALSLGHNYIGSEHILLGLGREGDGVAVRILHDLGADPETIHNEVIRMLSDPRVVREQVRRMVNSPRASQQVIDQACSVGWAQSWMSWPQRFAASGSARPTPEIYCWRSPARRTRWPPRRYASSG
jgi:ATP-dependent Clp protease ATP-binding subunit ClpC